MSEFINLTNDDFYDEDKPKAMNKRSSYASAFILQILMLHSSKDKPIDREQIAKYLLAEPYNLILERKKFGRDLNGLLNSYIGINHVKVATKEYYWYDDQNIYFDYAS